MSDLAHPFNFAEVALQTAIGEACDGSPESRTCSIVNPCVYCRSLAVTLQKALLRAYKAGQASMQTTSDNRRPSNE